MSHFEPIPKRHLPGRSLPSYSYVTGKFSHPLRDPKGHSHNAQAPQITEFSADRWENCEPYLWGIDLFNNGYYWEAHETWEAVWHAAGRRGVAADFCKALIKLAAAGVKAREGRPTGVQRHSQRAKQLVESVSERLDRRTETFMGLSLSDLIRSAQQLIDDPASIVDTSDAPVVLVMPFVLTPPLPSAGEGAARKA